MIEINLLPQELRPKPKKLGIDLESKETLYFIPLVFGVIIIIHVYLLGMLAFKNIQVGVLNNKWQKMELQRKALGAFHSETEQFSEEAKSLQQISSRSIKWAGKLNKLSLDLPTGIWFREISVRQGALEIKASVISLQQTEMGIISQFIDNLRKDADFFDDFSKLDLGPIEKRMIGGYEIADFALFGTLKSK